MTDAPLDATARDQEMHSTSDDREHRVPPIAVDMRTAAHAIGISQRMLADLTADPSVGVPHVRLGRRVIYPLRPLESWLADLAHRRAEL